MSPVGKGSEVKGMDCPTRAEGERGEKEKEEDRKDGRRVFAKYYSLILSGNKIHTSRDLTV